MSNGLQPVQPSSSPDYHAIFLASETPLLLLDTRYHIVDVNEAYLAATNTTRAMLVGHNVFVCFPSNPNDPAADGVSNLRASLDRVILHAVPDKMPVQKYDIPVRSREGLFEERYWSPINIPVVNGAGEVTHIVHRVRDVTTAVRLTQRRAGAGNEASLLPPEKSGRMLEILAEFVRKERDIAAALRASEAQLRTLVDSIPQLAWMANADGWIFWYNRRWYEYTGTTPEQMQGWGWQSVHDPQELPKVVERWKASLRTGTAFEMPFPLRSAAGEYRWFLTRVVPLKDPEGKVLRWFGTNTDVHELRQTQQRLRSSEERLRITQQAAGIGSWELNLDTDEFYWTDEAYAILGMERTAEKPTLNHLLRLMFYSADRENAQAVLRDVRRRKREIHINFRIHPPNADEPRWISLRGRAFYNQGENVLLGVMIDVTKSYTEVRERARRTPVRS